MITNNTSDDNYKKQINEKYENLIDPYNIHNKEIEYNDIINIFKKYDIPPVISNINLYKRAFIHRSYVKKQNYKNNKLNVKILDSSFNNISLKTKSNERLEFLGDGILEMVIKYYLYRRFPKENEGFMTEKKIALVKNETIGKIALDIGLNKWLILSKNAEEKNIRNNLKKLGCLFEAFIAAIFLDFNKVIIEDEEKWFKNIFICGPGFQIVQKFIENIFEKHIDWTNILQNDDNYKNILQVKIQKEFKITPCYLQLNYDVNKGYTMGVYLCIGFSIHNINVELADRYKHLKNYKEIYNFVKNNDYIFLLMGEYTHKIKRKAEQMASKSALKFFDDDVNT